MKMFEQLKKDVELILDSIYKNPEYYYENWIFRIIHSKTPKNKEVKEIFTKWHKAFSDIAEDPKDRVEIITTMDKVIYKTSVLKLATLLTNSKTNKEIIDFLCTVYECQDKKELAIEIFSNKIQNNIFKEKYNECKEEMIDYDKGLLVLDNLGIIEGITACPDKYTEFSFYDQLRSLTTGGWNTTPILSGLVSKEDFHDVRDFLDLEKMGRIEVFKVLDGQVRADVWIESGEGLSELLSTDEDDDDKVDPHNDYILRPIYLVEGLGLVIDPSLVKLDRLKRIAGFDLCEKPKNL